VGYLAGGSNVFGAIFAGTVDIVAGSGFFVNLGDKKKKFSNANV
jgi:hypothetical protein